MKKLALVLVALLTMVFTGCKTETSKVTVHVEDTLGAPVADRLVFYADWASLIIGEVLPSPEELVLDYNDSWEYAETNKSGKVDIIIPLSLSKLSYVFAVYDRGSNQWIKETRELHRGQNEEIKFEVNK